MLVTYEFNNTVAVGLFFFRTGEGVNFECD